jgi:hypothetical protein
MSKYYVNYQYIHNKNYNICNGYNGYKSDKFPFYTGKNKVHMKFKFNNDYKRYISTLTVQDEILLKDKNKENKENIEFKQLVENEYNVISLDKKNEKNQKENTNKENLENNEENSLLQQTSLLTKLWNNLPIFSYWK